MTKVKCFNCGANMIEYSYTFSGRYTKMLWSLYLAGGHAKNSELGFIPQEYTNFSKLQHWGLIKKDDKETDYWFITKKGVNFLQNKLRIPKTVVVYRNRVVDKKGGMFVVNDFVPDRMESFQNKDEILAEAMPHNINQNNIEGEEIWD